MGTEGSRLGLRLDRLGSGGSGVRATAEAFAAVALTADAGVRLLECSAAAETAGRMLAEVLPRDPAFRIALRVAGADEAAPARLRASLRTLRLERADAVVAPAGVLTGDAGAAVWGGLQRLRDDGLTTSIGVSACVCDDPAALARRLHPDFMQLPLSLLDQRLLTSGVLDAVAEAGVEVHLRSVLMQGVLFETNPRAAALASAPVLRVRRLLAEAGADPLQAALRFALATPQASQVMVSVGSPGELRALLRAAAADGPALDWPALGFAALRSETACVRTARGCMAA